MLLLFRFVVVPKEGVIEPEAQNDSCKRKGDRQKRQNTKFAGGELSGIERYEEKSEGTAYRAAYTEAERVFERLLYCAVDRTRLLRSSEL